MNASKLKTLMVFRYLEQLSDEENPLSTTDLIAMLAKDGISCERKSIYSDVSALKQIGVDIVTVTSPKRGFFIASRTFQIPEVRLLIDAVNSAGFITPKKSEELINKLKALLSENQAKAVAPQVYSEDVVKCDNEQIYIIIDQLDSAINRGKKVRFIYRTRNIDKENKKSYTSKTFVVSPYAMLWKNDRYYLVCNKSTHNNLINLRLDRIRKIEILDEPVRNISEISDYIGKLNAADYSSKMFNMFSGEFGRVKLLCELDMQEQIVDRFGKKAPLKAIDSDHFETEIEVAISDGFVSWVMQYGNKIKVVEPQYLVDMIKDKAQAILKMY